MTQSFQRRRRLG